MRTRLALALAPVALPSLLGIGCSGPSDEEAAAKKKIADELVTCQNDRSNLKEQLAIAQAEVKKLQEAANPTVKLDPMELAAQTEKHKEGNLPPGEVVKVFRNNQGGLKRCYEQGLKRNPNLQYVASLDAHFAIRNSGSASNVVFTPHADAEMERCMSQTIQKWKFPSFSGDPVNFDYPVSLVAK